MKLKITDREMLALFLRKYPHFTVETDNKMFWYDEKENKYFYYSLTNKVKNGVYEARGLMCAYNSYERRVNNG